MALGPCASLEMLDWLLLIHPAPLPSIHPVVTSSTNLEERPQRVFARRTFLHLSPEDCS